MDYSPSEAIMQLYFKQLEWQTEHRQVVRDLQLLAGTQLTPLWDVDVALKDTV